MDSKLTSRFERRARIAYEIGRAKVAAVRVVPIVVFAIAMLLVGERTPLTFIASGALVLAAYALNVASDALGECAVPGIATGLVPYVAITLARTASQSCDSPTCSRLCLFTCVASGVVGGVVTAIRVHRHPRRWPEVATTMAVAATVGTLACSCVGTVGVLMVGMGLVAGYLPFVSFVRSRSQ